MISLPKSANWQLVVNGETAGTEVIEVIKGDSVTVTPHSSYVLMIDDSMNTTNQVLLIAGAALLVIAGVAGYIIYDKKQKASK